MLFKNHWVLENTVLFSANILVLVLEKTWYRLWLIFGHSSLSIMLTMLTTFFNINRNSCIDQVHASSGRLKVIWKSNNFFLTETHNNYIILYMFILYFMFIIYYVHIILYIISIETTNICCPHLHPPSLLK